MKFKAYQDGDIRIKKRFLLFPKTIGDIKRWLEFAKWQEKFNVAEGLSWWESICWLYDNE